MCGSSPNRPPSSARARQPSGVARVALSKCTRRGLLGAGFASIALDTALAQQTKTAPERLVLLGTMGGPVPSATRAMASQALVVGGAAYLIDCGVGAVGRLAAAGIQPRDLTAIFITHLHDDHIGELPALMMAAWASGLMRPIDVYGPAPLSRMVTQFFEAFEPTIAQRTAEFPRPHPATLFRVHELIADGEVLQTNALTVSAVAVDHGDVAPAFGYRLATPSRTIVITGDTRLAPAVQRLARDADILVAEATYLPALQRQLQALPDGARMEALLRRIHMTAPEAGELATRAHVGALVLSHLIPGDDATITDAQWIAAAAEHFHGCIIVGRDLLEL